MARSQNSLLRLSLLCAAEALFLCGIYGGIRHETAAVNQSVSEVSDLKDPSPFRVALLGHLGKIHLGLQAYLRSPDPSLEKQMAESEKDFESLLPEFMQENPKLFPEAAGEEIKRVFALLKESIDHTLQANQQRMDGRTTLDKNFSQVLFLISHNISPLIRKTQADGEERSDSILNIENQTRAWQQNLAQAWEQPSDAARALAFENDSRGENYLELYSHMELLSRERKVLRDIRTLWQTNSDLARESFVKETIVGQAEKATEGEHEQVVSTLNKYLPAMPPAELEAKKQSIMNTMRLHLAGACLIGLFGLASIIAFIIGIYRTLHKTHSTAGAPKPTVKTPTLQMDLKGAISAWSDEAESLYGYSATEMRGQSIGVLFESESEIARLGQELQKAKRATFETTHKTKGGSPLRIRIEFQPVPDAAGHAAAIGLLCTRR